MHVASNLRLAFVLCEHRKWLLAHKSSQRVKHLKTKSWWLLDKVILKIITILTTLYLRKPLYVDLMQRIVDNLDCGKHNNDHFNSYKCDCNVMSTNGQRRVYCFLFHLDHTKHWFQALFKLKPERMWWAVIDFKLYDLAIRRFMPPSSECVGWTWWKIFQEKLVPASFCSQENITSMRNLPT